MRRRGQCSNGGSSKIDEAGRTFRNEIAMIGRHFRLVLLGVLVAGPVSSVCAADNGKALFDPDAYNAGTGGGGPGSIGGNAGASAGTGPGGIGGNAGANLGTAWRHRRHAQPRHRPWRHRRQAGANLGTGPGGIGGNAGANLGAGPGGIGGNAGTNMVPAPAASAAAPAPARHRPGGIGGNAGANLGTGPGGIGGNAGDQRRHRPWRHRRWCWRQFGRWRWPMRRLERDDFKLNRLGIPKSAGF